MMTGSIDLLITDMIMPDMTGCELAERIRVARPSIRVILMSGYTEDTVSHRALPGEDVTFMQKPLTPKMIVAGVREILDRIPAGEGGTTITKENPGEDSYR